MLKPKSPICLEFTLDISSLALEFILGCAYLFFCRGSGALARLSNVTINVYDFHIIMYFHLGQIMQNKPNYESAI
jgi:hypothetical protein